MTRRSSRGLIIAAGLITTAAMSGPSARAQAPAAALHLLDVPYVAQSESLCGGAAVAMVMRYWGTTDIYAETFADLVDPAAGGIHGADLLNALRARGWEAESFHGDPARVRAHLAARRPVVALIQDRPGRFHYVVIVGWSDGRIVAHDPARAPFRILDEKTFLDSWRPSDSWALVATPPVAAASGPTSADSPSAEPASHGVPHADAPCGGLIDEGVRLAGLGDRTGARRLFEVAAANCPAAAGPWREMAGLHALAGEWPAAAADAHLALSRDPDDGLAARILATALYLGDDSEGALEAWNRVGEPIIDLINIAGLERTRYAVAAHAMGLDPQTMLTPGALTAARRRLAELPSAQATRITLKPGERGRAQVDAAVIERPLLPWSPIAVTAGVLRALSDREALLTIASPTGGGEAWTASWRWWEHRPKVAVGFDSPAPFGGVWGVGFFTERQSYERDLAVFEESRRRAEFRVSNWTTRGLRWEGTVGIDRFGNAELGTGGRTLAAAASVQQRLAGDHAFVEMRAGSWAGPIGTWTLSLGGEWRSNVRNEGQVAIVRAGEAIAASNAPLALWPGAGTGQGREGLLRAHPLIDDGIIRNGAFGRRLIDGGVEWRRWMQPARKPIRLAPSVFVDVARAYDGLDPAAERWQSDVGAGLRVAIPGSGVLRIDLAHGLRDGRTTVSMGWGR